MSWSVNFDKVNGCHVESLILNDKSFGIPTLASSRAVSAERHTCPNRLSKPELRACLKTALISSSVNNRSNKLYSKYRPFDNLFRGILDSSNRGTGIGELAYDFLVISLAASKSPSTGISLRRIISIRCKSSIAYFARRGLKGHERQRPFRSRLEKLHNQDDYLLGVILHDGHLVCAPAFAPFRGDSFILSIRAEHR